MTEQRVASVPALIYGPSINTPLVRVPGDWAPIKGCLNGFPQPLAIDRSHCASSRSERFNSRHPVRDTIETPIRQSIDFDHVYTRHLLPQGEKGEYWRRDAVCPQGAVPEIQAVEARNSGKSCRGERR